MEIEECEHLPGGEPLWLAATDGNTLYFNPVNANKLPLDQCVGLLKHELLHVALMHNFRFGSRERRKFNKAADYVINDIVVSDGGAIPDGGCYEPAKYGKHQSEEEVYALMPSPPDGGGEGKGTGKGKGGSDPFHDDLLPAPDQSPEAQQKAVGRIIKAAQVAKAMGKLPSYIESALGEILDARIPWEQELAEFLTEVSRNDFTFARPNRRFVYQDLYLPSAYSQDSMGRLAVILDTSGSVSERELRRYVSEVVGAIEGTLPLALTIVYCDMEVQHVDHFDDPNTDEVLETVKRHGCGGTDMTVALDWVDENIDDVKACIVFTDGGTPFGHERDYPTLWGISVKGIQADMGRTIYVDAG